MIVALLVAVVFIASALGGGESGPSTTASKPDASAVVSPGAGDGADDSPSDDAPTFKNGVLKTPDLTIRITRYKIIGAGQRGNESGDKPVIGFWYRTTNVSGERTDPATAFVLAFDAYQDNNPNAENELDDLSVPDERFLDSQTENIKKGGTVSNAVSFALDDLTTPVDLVATEGLDGQVGKTTYKLR